MHVSFFLFVLFQGKYIWINDDPVSFQQWNNIPSDSNNYQIQLKIIYIFKKLFGFCKNICLPDESLHKYKSMEG